jgi:DNA-directed RNA polymerase specialized sigma24 family protein
MKGQPLFGIYQAILTELQQQLTTVITREIDCTEPPKLPSKAWAQEQLKYICKQHLDNTCLTDLALTAQHYPPQSELREYALNELIQAVSLSGQLRCTRKIYDVAIWDEAIHRTLIYIYQKIGNFDPERGKFTTWINFRFDRILIEVWQEHNSDDEEPLPPPIDPPPDPSLATLVRHCLEEDDGGQFSQEHIRGCPEANFRTIVLSRLSGTSWETISSQFQIKVSTLSSFFQRGCKKFRPVFEQYIQDHSGYT